jgi:beta-phosphoglucomutase-like phosphatase (HAD superfamily)
VDEVPNVVLVDMDGVLADFDRRVVELLGDACPELHTADARTDFYLKHAYPQYAEQIRAVIDGRKEAYFGTVLIDDRPYVRGSGEARWRHVVFDAAYNRRVRAPRLLGWRDPGLPRLLADAREG